MTLLLRDDVLSRTSLAQLSRVFWVNVGA